MFQDDISRLTMEEETNFDLPLAASTPKKQKADRDLNPASILESDTAESILFYSEGESASTDSLLFYSADKKDESILFYSPSAGHEAEFSYSATSAGDDLLFYESEERSAIPMTISRLLEEPCCRKGCLKYLSPAEVCQARHHFSSKTPEEQRQYLLDCETVSSVDSAQPQIFALFGKGLCKKGFALVLDCSTKRLDRVAALLREGVAKVSHRNVGQLRQTTKTTDAIAWMNSYFQMIGEHMPDCDRIHLPSFLTKRDVYERMVAELRENGLDEKEIISLSQFYSVWESQFASVLIPEVSHFHASEYK